MPQSSGAVCATCTEAKPGSDSNDGLSPGREAAPCSRYRGSALTHSSPEAARDCVVPETGPVHGCGVEKRPWHAERPVAKSDQPVTKVAPTGFEPALLP